jgi:hypothetical protein
MTDHQTGTREEWLVARLDPLKEEKLTRRSDEQCLGRSAS